ncbi:MAG: TetR-like C-terminal domain-containing protein, partial [Lysinibacillus sp.]
AHEHVNGYFYSYTTNAILGLIIEWYRRDFQESAEEMNIQLVKIINVSYENGEVKK